MQLKLLNIHKLLSNIATNLVGAFVPVIIYEATNNLVLSVLFYALQYLLRILCVFIFNKPFQSKPQIMLLIRVLPILLYSVFVLLIEVNMWVGIIGVVIFNGFNDAFKRMPSEFILNYSSLKSDNESTVGFSRLMEQVGYVVSFLIGGYLLGINKILVVVISLVVYAISVVPLVIYYYKSKSDKTFNKEAVSNAQLTFKKDEKKYNYGKKLSKKMLLIYGTTYFVYCFVDAFSSLFNIFLFATNGSYAIAGLFNAIYNGTFGVGNWMFGKVAEKRDIQIDVVVCSIISGVCIFGISFINVIWVQFVLFGILGLTYAPITLFNFQRLIVKSRILGNSNSALMVREQSSNASVVAACLPVVFGTVVPCFIVIGISFFVSAFIIPYHEEKSRRLLVDYLQYNEIKSRGRKHSKS